MLILKSFLSFFDSINFKPLNTFVKKNFSRNKFKEDATNSTPTDHNYTRRHVEHRCYIVEIWVFKNIKAENPTATIR